MNITYNDYRQKKRKTLEEVLMLNAEDYYHPKPEQSIERLVSVHVRLVELLHSKGVITDQDIKDLVSPYICSEDADIQIEP